MHPSMSVDRLDRQGMGCQGQGGAVEQQTAPSEMGTGLVARRMSRDPWERKDRISPAACAKQLAVVECREFGLLVKEKPERTGEKIMYMGRPCARQG